MSRVEEQLWRILPAVRPEERPRALFFAGLLTLISAAQTIGLTASEALFLGRLSASRLPEAFVLASLVTVLGSLLYAARVGNARNDSLFVQLLLGAGILLLTAPLIQPDAGPVMLFGLIAGFYLTQSIFTNHFWTFSTDFFDTSSAKRLFPVFTVGASLGGLLGGAAGALCARIAGPMAAVAVWGALLCASALLLLASRTALRRWGPMDMEEADETSVAGLRSASAYLRHSPLGRWLVLSAIGMVMALFVAQFIYLDLFATAYPDPGSLAVFIGVYLALTNLIEIALELWLTPWLIRRFGVASAHLFHPVLTVASFVALIIAPTLASAIVARANRELVENAVAQPLRTMVFNALPERFRGRIRAFLEGVTVYGGMGAAGLLLLAIGRPDLQSLCLLGIAAALLYFVANLGARQAYLDTLVTGLRSGQLDLTELDEEIGGWEESRLASLCAELLQAETETPSLSLMQLIESLGQRGSVEPLLPGLRHPLAEVRVASIRAISAAGAGLESRSRLSALLRDEDPSVRAVAARACWDRETLAQMLAAEDSSVRLAAVREVDAGLSAELATIAVADAPPLRAAALRRLSLCDPAALDAGKLGGAMDAADPDVRRAALELCAAARHESLAARVAGALRDPVADVRHAAAMALSQLGDAGFEAALPAIQDPREGVANAALAAVSRSTNPRRREVLAAELLRRAGLAWRTLVGATFLDPGDDPAHAIARAAASDALRSHRRVAFETLAHLESPRLVRKVRQALRFDDARRRGDALEVLSNLGHREAARLLVLLHENSPLQGRIAGLGAGFALPGSLDDFLADAAASGDVWLVRAAAALGADRSEHRLEEDFPVDRLLALKRVPLFEHLSLEQLERMSKLTRDTRYLPGEVIVHEGDPGDELFLIFEGRVEAWLDFGGSRARLLSTIDEGGYFGEMAILGDELRSASVVALEPTHLLVLDGRSLTSLVHQMPEIAFELMRVLTSRVRASERLLREQRATSA